MKIFADFWVQYKSRFVFFCLLPSLSSQLGNSAELTDFSRFTPSCTDSMPSAVSGIVFNSVRTEAVTTRPSRLGLGRFFEPCFTQTLPSDSPLDSSVLVSHTNLRGGRSGTRGRGQRPHCTYCNKLGHTRDRCYQLHGRPPRTAHVAQSSDSDSQLPQTLSSFTSQGVPPTDSEYDAFLRYQAAKSASVASIAQTGNASACLTHTSSLGP